MPNNQQPKPLVLIAACVREGQHHLRNVQQSGTPETKVTIITPSYGYDRLRGLKPADFDVQYVDGWSRTVGQGAAYKAKVHDLTDYLKAYGWM